MVTLALQAASALLSLLFGLVALYAASGGSPGQRRNAWLLTGYAFSIAGLVAFGHAGIWASIAFHAGPDTPAWTSYISYLPVWNNARSVLKIAFAASLILLPFIAPAIFGRFGVPWLILLTVSFVGGALAGLYQGSSIVVQFFTISATGIVQTILIGTALVIHLQKDSMDRLLWLCLVVYTVRVHLGVIWAASQAWFGVPGVEVPGPALSHGFGVAANAVILALALRYAHLQRRGRHVPAFLEHLSSVTVRSIG